MSRQITEDVVETALAVLSEALESVVIIGVSLDPTDRDTPVLAAVGEARDCKALLTWAEHYLPVGAPT
jgi:hypothetical protein